MRVETSLTMNMFTYQEPEPMVRECLRAYFLSVKKYPQIPFNLIDNFPGWEFSDNIKFVIKEFPQVKIINNILNQGQARNWNQITRLAIMDKKEFCGVIAPDTIVHEGWVEKINENIDKYDLFHHLNFSVWKVDTIRKLKWFDERCVSGGSEDLDIYFRFEEAGIPYSRTLLSEFEKRGDSNQYRNTNEHIEQFYKDNKYWLTKWSKLGFLSSGAPSFPKAQDIWDKKELRQRNWEDIDWYPKVLDRDIQK